MIKTNAKHKLKIIENRINKIPEYSINVIDAKLKKDASNIIKEFQTGIEKGTLNLKPLKEATIKQKRYKGYSNPKLPLLGKGGNNKRSYKNMLMLKKVKNGYKIEPSIRMHREASLTLKQLFYVHEYGTIIHQGDKLIRIPARPALLSSYKKILQKKNLLLQLFSRNYKKAIVNYINTGESIQINEMINKYVKGVQKEES
jgi:hypothetical protein